MKLKTTLKRPILTEKSLRLAKENFFTFEVDLYATKHEITDAINKQFNVNALDVHTQIMKGKTRRVGRIRKETKSSNWKKATVQLGKDKKIPLFDVS